MTTLRRDGDMARTGGVTRRSLLKGGAVVGVAAAAGLEGILAARRAPAFAQGTRLHIVRWVDFIPACDVELKRQAGDASKALGAEVVFEFINANDIQARITAAMQSGAGPDIIQMLHNWPHLYANGLVDVSDLVAWQVKEQGALYTLSDVNVKVGGKYLALPHGIVPGLIAYRKSWFDEVGATTFPKTLRGAAPGHHEAQEEGPSLRPDPRAHLRRRSGLGVPADVELRRDGGRQERQDRDRQQGDGGSGQVHAPPSGRTAATRAAWPGTTPTTTGPSWPARSAAR